MVAIFPFPKEQCAFDPKDVSAMSTAFEEVCKALLRDQVSERLGPRSSALHWHVMAF